MTYLILLIVLTSISQVLLKLNKVTGKLHFLLLSIFLFMTLPVFSHLALRTLDIGEVYMSTAATYVLVLIFSFFVLNEEINRGLIGDMLFVFFGVVLYNFS